MVLGGKRRLGGDVPLSAGAAEESVRLYVGNLHYTVGAGPLAADGKERRAAHGARELSPLRGGR